MNRSESANFHNSMESIYQRTLLATNPKNYIPIAIGEFAKELYENPSCQHIRDVLQKEGQQVFMPFQKARSETLTTFTQAIAALKNHNTKPIDLSDLLNIIDDIQSNVHLTETERLYALLKPIEEAYNLLVRNAQNNSMDHSAVLNQLNYQPMLQKYFHEEQILERLIKTATFNSFHYLTKNYALNYDLRKRSNRINSFTDDTANYLNNESNNFDEALEAQTNQNALLQGFDTEECKIHVDRIRNFIEQKLTLFSTKQSILPTYASWIIKGTFVTIKFNNKLKPFNIKHITGRLIKALCKHPHEALTYELLWKIISNEPCEYALDQKEIAQLEEARKSINKVLNKIGLSCFMQKSKETLPNSEKIIRKMLLNSDYIEKSYK